MKTIWKKLLCVCLAGVMLVGAAPVSAAQEQVAYLQASYINPLYEGVQPAVQNTPAARSITRAVVCRDSVQEAAKDLREGMKKRQETVQVSFMSYSNDQAVLDQLFQEAFAHTGDPAGGDYLFWHLAAWGAGGSVWNLGGKYRLDITCTMQYISTPSQEQAVDAAVKKLLDQLNVYHLSDYQKVVAIHDYICENIQYDYVGINTSLAHTAYAALINKKSVCQGYASLFYRLALELGVDSRVINGIGNGGAHGWNIVKLDGLYYNLDSTWDAEWKQFGLNYQYFLKSDANFPDHYRDDKFRTVSFYQAYPMGQKNYTPTQTVQKGNLDGVSGVTEDDAIYLLQHVLLPDVFPVSQNVDFDKSGVVDESDAIYLLQHVLLPEFFPLT